MKIKKLIAYFTVLSMVMSMLSVCGVTAFAAEPVFVITPTNSGDSIAEGTDYGYMTFSDQMDISTTTPVTISMAPNVDKSEHVISIDTSKGDADVTLNNLNIEIPEESYNTFVIQVKGGNDCNLNIVGTNTLVTNFSTGVVIVNANITTASSELTITGNNGAVLNMRAPSSAITEKTTADFVVNVEGELKVDAQSTADYYNCIRVAEFNIKNGAEVIAKSSKINVVEGKCNVSPVGEKSYRVYRGESDESFSTEYYTEETEVAELNYKEYYFEAKMVDVIPLTEATVEIAVPVKNESPSQYVLVDIDANYTASSAVWYDEEGEQVQDKFLGGKKYTAEFKLIPNSGTAFTNTTDVTVANASVTKKADNDGSITIKATFAQTEAAEVSSIAVKTEPNDVNYIYGETFKPAGLVITATYDDGTKKDISYNRNVWDFSFSPERLTVQMSKIIVTYKGKTAEISINVDAKDANGLSAVISPSSATYDTKEKKPTVYVMGLTEGIDFDVIYPDDMTNVGDKSIKVKFKGNYSGEINKTFKIEKADAKITVNTTDIVKTYGDDWELPTATSNFGEVKADKTVEQLKNKGSYTVKYTVAGTDNYNGDEKTVNVTINPLPVNITWNGTENLVFDNTEKTITYTLANEVSGDNVTLTVEGTLSATEKGTYTATVTAVDNDNYTLTGGVNLTKAWSIAETTNSWVSALDISDWTYGDTASTPTATAKFGTPVFTYADSVDGAYTEVVPTAVGTYYVKATVTGAISYAEISDIKEFVIEARTLNADNITAIADVTFTGEEIKPTLEIKDGDYPLVEGTDYDVTYFDNINASTTETQAKAAVTFKGNYQGTAEKAFTILPKQISNAIVLTAPVKNEAPQTEITGDGYTATVVWSPEVTDKFKSSTEYTATITITVDGNHTIGEIAENGYVVEGAKSVTNAANSNEIIVAFARTGSSGGGGGGSVTTSYTVKFETDGADEIKDVKVTKNKTVAEPTEPTKDGYTFVGWFTDEELTLVYDFETKVTKSFTLYAKWEKVEEKPDETDTPDTPVWGNPFEDVNASDWYYADVEYAAQNGLFNGTTETTFAPNGIITRAMMVTVLYRNEGEPEVTGEATFEDVDENAYYAKAVVWGQLNGIIKGYSETEFAPDENITREQIAAIMHRYAKYKGYDVSVGENTNILSYDDFASISEYAIASMQYAVGSGLMKGKTESTLNPQDNATRAEIAAILHRFIEANK